jgi:hypothetical protein
MIKSYDVLLKPKVSGHLHCTDHADRGLLGPINGNVAALRFQRRPVLMAFPIESVLLQADAGKSFSRTCVQ